jgi:MFS family permease
MSNTGRWCALLAVSVGSMMAGLDSSVTNTVLPIVATSLGADVATTQWIVLVYLLITTVLVLSAGRFGDLRGHRRLYLLGFALFITSSAACGFAPAIGWLVTARGCQALGGGDACLECTGDRQWSVSRSRAWSRAGVAGHSCVRGASPRPVHRWLPYREFGWGAV